jgi:hypothetical protein
LAELKRLLRVRTTNDKILVVYLRENNDTNDGIYYEEIDRSDSSSISPGEELTGINIIKKSEHFAGEDVKGIIVDTNHIDNPSAYIITLCFHTENKLYMGRVSGDPPIWTKCADSPKDYGTSKILVVFSTFTNADPVKFVNLQNSDGSQSVRPERH